MGGHPVRDFTYVPPSARVLQGGTGQGRRGLAGRGFVETGNEQHDRFVGESAAVLFIQARTHEPGMDDTIFEGAKVHRDLQEFSLEEILMRFELPKDHAFSKYTRTHSELLSDVPAFRAAADLESRAA